MIYQYKDIEPVTFYDPEEDQFVFPGDDFPEDEELDELIGGEFREEDANAILNLFPGDNEPHVIFLIMPEYETDDEYETDREEYKEKDKKAGKD